MLNSNHSDCRIRPSVLSGLLQDADLLYSVHVYAPAPSSIHTYICIGSQTLPEPFITHYYFYVMTYLGGGKTSSYVRMTIVPNVGLWGMAWNPRYDHVSVEQHMLVK